MILNEEGLKNRAAWEEKGYRLPRYDREAMVARTKENPTWLHSRLSRPTPRSACWTPARPGPASLPPSAARSDR